MSYKHWLVDDNMCLWKWIHLSKKNFLRKGFSFFIELKTFFVTCNILPKTFLILCWWFKHLSRQDFSIDGQKPAIFNTSLLLFSILYSTFFLFFFLLIDLQNLQKIVWSAKMMYFLMLYFNFNNARQNIIRIRIWKW